MRAPIQFDFSGQTAVVTGGGGVLCGCMAEALAACGAAVAVTDLRAEAARAVADRITAAGGRAAAVPCNVLERPSLEAACAQIESELGPVSLLINGAGGNHPRGTTSAEQVTPALLEQAAAEVSTFYDLDPDGIRFVFDLNVLGTMLAAQIFTRGMAARGGGAVVNISSMNAFRPLTKIPAYSAAKAAVSNFTQWLAVHLAPAGVRVNALAPGFFLTEQNRTLLTQADGALTPRGETIVRHTPMGRFGQPADLVGTLLWLLSDDAAGFVTGIVVPVDGGFAAYSGV